jgi:ketosteroid isomerase-like protein
MATTKTTPDLSITTTDHPNAIAMRAAFAAFDRGDLDTVRESFAKSCTWTNAGSSPVSGTFEGWDAILGMFGRLIDMTGGTYKMAVQSTLADDQRAVAIYDATSTVAGVKETHRFVLIDELDAQGKVTSTHSMAYDQKAADAHANRT